MQHGRDSILDARRCLPLTIGQQEKKSQALPEVHAQFERSKQASIQASEQNALDQGDMDSGAAVSDGEEDDANDYRLPISHEAALEGGRPAWLLHAARLNVALSGSCSKLPAAAASTPVSHASCP